MENLKEYAPKKHPGDVSLIGKYVRVEPIDWDVHAENLDQAITGKENSDLWTYIPFGPFDDIQSCKAVMSYVGQQFDWQSMCIVSQNDNTALGTASYMRLRPQYGSAEIGCVVFGKSLQKTREATEAMYLMASHLFDDLGYRRYEWKCDNSNEASRRAAERFGFIFEGVFRNDMVVKGKNRDTAWFSIVDADWPELSKKYKKWLDVENFDEQAQQIKRLEDCL